MTTKTGKPHPKVKFSPEEDFRLRAIILRFGDHDWNLISSLMKDRNPRQCRERWLKYLAPNVRFEPWSPEEDKQLERLVHDFGQKWVKISRFFRNRTDINVKNRWLVLQRQKAKKSTDASSSSLTSSPISVVNGKNGSLFNGLVNEVPSTNSVNANSNPNAEPLQSSISVQGATTESSNSFTPPIANVESISKQVLPVPIFIKSSHMDLSPLDEPFAIDDPTEKAIDFLENNTFTVDLWDGLLPPSTLEFETPIDSFHWN